MLSFALVAQYLAEADEMNSALNDTISEDTSASSSMISEAGGMGESHKQAHDIHSCALTPTHFAF